MVWGGGCGIERIKTRGRRGSSSSAAHLWDSGANAVDGVESIDAGARGALRRFGEKEYSRRRAACTLRTPLGCRFFMLHRYQVEATKQNLLAGWIIRLRCAGMDRRRRRLLARQSRDGALAAVLATLKPEALELPERY